MSYGFRLFTVEVARGPAGRKPLLMESVGDAGSQHYADHIEECMEILAGWSTLTGAPALKPAARLRIQDHRRSSGERGDPRIRFLSHSWLEERHLLFHVEYGRLGRYPKALAMKAVDDAHIDGLATGHAYRCLILLPEAGTRGLLAVEDVSSTTPARIVPNWLSRASDWRARKSKPAVKAKSVRLIAQQIKDLPRLRELIKTADDASLRLTKKTVSASSKRKTTKVKLDYKIDTKADRDDVINWAENFAGLGNHNLHGDGVAAMTDIVDGSLTSVGFTDAVVVLKGPAGTKKVSANRLDELFVYPVAEDRPSDDEFVNEVMSVVGGMQAWLQINLESQEEEGDGD